MRDITININQAKILSYSVELGEECPTVSATIGLFKGEKQISSFSLTTQQWMQGVKFDIPAGMIPPIVKIADQLEAILIEECSRSMNELPAHAEESDVS